MEVEARTAGEIEEATHNDDVETTTDPDESLPLLPTKRSLRTMVPEVEVHLYRRGTGPIDVFKSALGGWEQDQIEIGGILDKYGFKSVFAFNPESGRGFPIRFHPRNGRSLLPYADGSVIVIDGEPKVRLSDTGTSSSGRATLISPSDYFADPDMSRRLNLAAMVGCSGSRVPSASPGSTPSMRATSSRCPLSRLFTDARCKHSSSPTAWALTLLRGDCPVNIEDSVGSLETAIALAQGLLLPPDMIKEKESSLDMLERTIASHGIRAIQKMVEVCKRARQGGAKLTRLTAENARLLGELETERGKGKEAEVNFAKVMEELGKAEENVRIFEENISEAYDNGFDEASRQFKDQDRVPEGLDLTITEISDEPFGPVVPPTTSAVPGQQGAGSSSAAASVDRSGPLPPLAPLIQSSKPTPLPTLLLP
ncbi:hypothetical protein RHSIM_Rhsim06G0093300 [Rhododendron simsii]|uniref:Uncharacterized protein n=1 Tax=Rhododendron simsii TaxID=118357 RepID=A0A834LMW1_RHOSS|nr:hypothetical protein RHSIM_Rhsim06G0093300 [Rhododendron simsii]